MPHGPPRNLLKFGGNPDHVTLRLWLGLLLTFDVTPGRTVLRLGEGRVVPHNTLGLRLFNSNQRRLSGPDGGMRSTECPSSNYYADNYLRAVGRKVLWSSACVCLCVCAPTHGRCWPRPVRRFVSPSDTVVYILSAVSFLVLFNVRFPVFVFISVFFQLS